LPEQALEVQNTFWGGGEEDGKKTSRSKMQNKRPAERMYVPSRVRGKSSQFMLREEWSGTGGAEGRSAREKTSTPVHGPCRKDSGYFQEKI